MIELTIQDRDTPTVWVNPAQVVSIKGRKGYRPDVASQSGGIQTFPQGAEIALSNGDKLNVLESPHEARIKLFGSLVGKPPAPPADKPPDKPPAPAKKVAAAPKGGAAQAKQVTINTPADELADIDLFAEKD